MRFFGKLATAISICFLVLFMLVIIVALGQCKHEETKTMYSFVSYRSPSYNYVRPVCKKCGKLLSYTNFKGTPIDTSYLKVFENESKGNRIVPGEYYTVTAIVTGADYSIDSTRLGCKVENEDFIIHFSVNFREEFEEAVDPIEEDYEVTFRGRFYDTGCGFTDCELLDIKEVE